MSSDADAASRVALTPGACFGAQQRRHPCLYGFMDGCTVCLKFKKPRCPFMARAGMFVCYLYITFSGIVPGCHLFVNGRLLTDASCSIRATFPSKRWLFMYSSSFVTVTTVQVNFFFYLQRNPIPFSCLLPIPPHCPNPLETTNFSVPMHLLFRDNNEIIQYLWFPTSV